jgi:hypothetical protein
MKRTVSNFLPTRRELGANLIHSNFKPYRKRKLEMLPTSFFPYRVWVPLNVPLFGDKQGRRVPA